MTKYQKIIKFIKKHRERGIGSFNVSTNSDTFILTAKDCGSTEEEWKEKMLRLPYK